MTHRVFSRNASSSRAMPVDRVLRQVVLDPAGPIYWGANQRGMQARKELTGIRKTLAKVVWRSAGLFAAAHSWLLKMIGLHKQIANRLTESHQYITVVVTATEWGNFFTLRCHPDAQPEIQELAQDIRMARAGGKPRLLRQGEWHLPFVSDEEFKVIGLADAIAVSVARCARTSYNTFDGALSTVAKDLALYDDLLIAEPMHGSPAEHQATPCDGANRNLNGWRHHRQDLEEAGSWA